MSDTIEDYKQAVEQFTADTADELERFRIEYMGRKGVLKALSQRLRDIPNDQKREFGQQLNDLKTAVQHKLDTLKADVQAKASAAKAKDVDVSLDAAPFRVGSRHPVAVVRNRIVDIFRRVGFTVAEGNEIVSEWYNFTALNIPDNHPARDMQDTFYVREAQGDNDAVVLRTHSSSVQTQYMEKHQPPIRTISPARVYRNETISARSHCQFHQVEGLVVDEGTSFADLKQMLFYFVQEMFGKDAKVRFRPSYFPFTEPSAEMDVTCFICDGTGCNVCKHSGWVEILGCGMVDPAVLDNAGIDSTRYTGYAFGMGIDRTAMLFYGVNDIRLFYENDVRFLQQFRSAGV